VDDFSTGYSALGYLKNLHLSSLKIDRSFTQDASVDTRTAAIVDAIVVFAHDHELDVVAEGIKTPAQLDCLRSVNCDEYHGFVVSSPLSANRAEVLLKGNQLSAAARFR
jgi:EAL domain-containing protein (putative c-di-GMP-specific phosphodiesterase class I)